MKLYQLGLFSKRETDEMCKVHRCHRNIQDVEVANVKAEAELTSERLVILITNK